MVMNSNNQSTDKKENNQSLTLNSNTMKFEQFVSGLKMQDKKNEKLMKNLKWLYIVLIVFYTGLMIVNPDPDLQIYHRISGIFYVLAFILFALYFKQLYKEFHSIDYSITLKELLQKAAKRYKSAFSNIYRILIPLLLLDAGVTISFYHQLSSVSPLERIVYIQLVYLSIMAAAAYVGYRIFMKQQYPLSERAQELLKELEE